MSTLYTIGHSNHSIASFLEILIAHGIDQLVDVRSIPKSRWVPWFNQYTLARTLKKQHVIYHHLSELGGRRSTHKNSINTGWEKASFRGYADYMQTDAFFAGLKLLNQLLKHHKTAIMCAEAVPWRCHRSLIADAELVRGIKVYDIFSKTNVKEHQLTAFSVVDRHVRPIKVFYPDVQRSF